MIHVHYVGWMMHAMVIRHVVMLNEVLILLISNLVHCILEMLREILGKTLLYK